MKRHDRVESPVPTGLKAESVSAAGDSPTLYSRRTFGGLLIGSVAPLLAGASVWAQGPAVKERRFAFLVGVTEYTHANMENLEYCDADIQQLADVLETGGFDAVMELTSTGGLRERPGKVRDGNQRPTAAVIRNSLRAFLKQQQVTKYDLIVVGLSGHGLQPLGSTESYFCPQDANPHMESTEDGNGQKPIERDTLLGLSDDVLKILNESGIGYRLLLVDACREIPKYKGVKGGIDSIPFNLQSTGAVQTALLLSCSPGERSYEDKRFGEGHGAFFHQVLEGLLQGRAANADQNVTVNSLADHVSDKTHDLVNKVFNQPQDNGAVQNPNLVVNVKGKPRVLLAKGDLERIRGGRLPARVTPTPDVGKKAGEERDDNGLKMQLVWCPAGTFTMGSPKSEKDRDKDEDQVQVTLTAGFWLGKYEVTQGEWERVMGTTPWKGQRNVKEGPRYAANYISWDDAMEFVKTLTAQERQAGRLPAGWEYTLPTEAEWEYACRAETKTAYSFGDAATQLSDYAWWGVFSYNGNAEKKRYPLEVGVKKPNAWGLHDLHGNVFEWCADGYEEKLLGGRDPLTAQASVRVYRGGGWLFNPSHCRSAYRGRSEPGYRNFFLGFRVARSPVR